MKKTKTMVLLTALIMSLGFISCKKTEGPAGPAGKDGTNGTNGNANVMTTTVNVTSGNWIFDNTDNSYVAAISWASITSAVVSKGTVQVFISNGTNSWVAIPYSYQDYEMNFSYESGFVYISANAADGTNPGNPGAALFKVVAIPAP